MCAQGGCGVVGVVGVVAACRCLVLSVEVENVPVGTFKTHTQPRHTLV